MAKFRAICREFLTPALVLILGAVVVYDHFVVRDPAAAALSVDGKALGRRFAVAVAVSFGDAWLTAADTLERGKPMAEAQAALQRRWQAGRTQAFSTLVTPEFTKVLREGVEPTDPSQRAQVVKLWRDFAAGLRGGK